MLTLVVLWLTVRLVFLVFREQSDQSFAIETASNAIRAQDKSEHSMYNKDLAQTIKKEFDAQKGLVYLVYH